MPLFTCSLLVGLNGVNESDAVFHGHNSEAADLVLHHAWRVPGWLNALVESLEERDHVLLLRLLFPVFVLLLGHLIEAFHYFGLETVGVRGVLAVVVLLVEFVLLFPQQQLPQSGLLRLRRPRLT